MSGGFDDYLPAGSEWEESAEPGGDYVELLLARPQYPPGTAFWYSDPSAHLVAAVLAAALERGGCRSSPHDSRLRPGEAVRSAGHLDPPDRSQPLPDILAPEFVTAGFGWATDPNGIELGMVGLRLTAPDMMKIGELCRRDGVWHRAADRAGRLDPAVQRHRRHSTPTTACSGGSSVRPYGPGYAALGRGGQHITVLPKSRAVIVYLSDVQPGQSEIGEGDTEALVQLLDTAFR